MASKPSFDSSAIGSIKCGADLWREYDNTEREADLYLFTRPVVQSLPDVPLFNHWALVFHFEGNDFRTVEGFGEEDDMLYGAYSKVPPSEKGTYFILGKVSTSPYNVMDMTRTNPENNMLYDPTWHNCQTWVKAIVAMLGDEIAKKLEDFKSLKEANPAFALAVKMISGSSKSSRDLYNRYSS